MVTKSYPHPSHWQDFERLCRDLYAAEWSDASAQLNGRNGDDQNGVDVFGTAGGRRIGVQCKLREQWSAGTVTAAQVRAEAEKARRARDSGSEPRAIDELVIATTALRAQAAQREAAALTGDPGFPFSVRVDSWDEINDLLGKHAEVCDTYMGWDRAGDGDEYARERDNYLASLRERLRTLPMAAIHKDLAKAPTLDKVYTELDVTRALSVSERALEDVGAHETNPYLRSLGERMRASAEEEDDDTPPRRLRAIEFLAAHRYAVLLGPPGSGKTAFAVHVALCLAGARLPDRGAAELERLARSPDGVPAQEVWPYGALVPLLVDLRSFVADDVSFPGADEDVHAGHLLDHLVSDHARWPLERGFLPHVRKELLEAGAGRGVLVLLDGLDETSSQGTQRERLRRVIEVFTEHYSNARVLVTSRPYAYRNDDGWRLPGFHDETLADLTPAAIDHFVRAWYGALAESGTLGRRDVGDRPADLVRQLRQPQLAPMARRPLTLTLVTSLHASGQMAQGGRADVYARSVELFFDRWNQVRLGESEDSFEERFGLTRGQVLDMLQSVAFRVHSNQASAGTGDGEAAQIPLGLLWDELQKARGGQAGVTEGDLLEHLDTRSGILLAEGKQTFRFPHRSFQEYLAAQHLNADEEFPDELCAAVRSAPEAWREVLAFSVLGHASQGGTIKNVWDVVGELLPEDPADAATDDDHRIAITLGCAFAESERLRVGSGKKRHEQALARLRTWLERTLTAGVLQAKDRIAAGTALGALGDPRIANWRANLLPLEGTDVAAGRFPVTVAEYAAFLASPEYGRDELWEGAPRRWSEPGGWSAQEPFPNRPVTGVSWFEANAYCRWLAAASASAVTLPEGETQERMAQPDGREWPWGPDEPDAERANFGKTVGHPSPVGCYPAGAAAGEHLDVGGNVWEWYGPSAGQAGIGGGSWLDGADFLRAGFRNRFVADDRHGHVGFRVCAPASTGVDP